MEHIVKTYILLLFSLLVSSIGYAQEENDIIYIPVSYTHLTLPTNSRV